MAEAPKTLKELFSPISNNPPSCIILLETTASHFELKPHIINLLPNFHGMEKEDPYMHVKDFLDICSTFKFQNFTNDSVRLRLFTFSLKDKAKAWLNSLPSGVIISCDTLTQKFLSKFFPMSRTNSLRKDITDFYQRDSEMFFEGWERFKDLLLKCPHHGFEKWRLVQHFYNGLTQIDRSMIESMKGGRFLNLNATEAYEFLKNLSESSQQWDYTQRDRNTKKAGMHEISADTNINIKLDALTRKIEALALIKSPAPVMNLQNEACNVCASPMHQSSLCPSYHTQNQPSCPEQANLMYDNNKFGNSYNPNWRNHPNLSWKPNPPSNNFNPPPNNFGPPNVYRPPFQNPQNQGKFFPQNQSQLSLEDTLKAFMQATTSHIHESQSHMRTTSQAISKLETQIGQLATQMAEREKGKLPSQPIPNPRNQCNQASGSSSHEDVQAIITLRSGKKVNDHVTNPGFVQEGAEENEATPNEDLQEQHDAAKNKESPPEPDISDYVPKAPFPQRLQRPKNIGQHNDILELFKHVQINIPFLDAIKQVPAYAKFLKDLVTAKKRTNVPKKAFLTEHVSSVILNKYPVKYKDPGSPTITCKIGNFPVDRALLDLGASINLIPYSTYLQMGLGDLKPTEMRI